MNYFHLFYVQPFYLVCIEIVVLWLAWFGGMLLLPRRYHRGVATVFCAVSLVIIYCLTLIRYSRVDDLSLIPFYSFVLAMENREFYRTMLMNVFLFVPFGMSVVFIMPEKLRHRVLLTVLIGVLLSVTVELCQHIFMIGKCEVDDVIMNGLGTFIGASTMLVYNAVQKRIKRKKND